MSSYHLKASPKSISFKLKFFLVSDIFSSKRKFSGLRSLWEIFCPWQYLMAESMSVNIYLASFSLRLHCFSR